MALTKLIIYLSLLLTAVTAYECPQDCICTTVHRQHNTYNHAKCTSLDGLRQIGKTSAIQSLDCSNIGITKITNQFDKITNLTQLDLSGNRLSEVSRLSKRIKTLNLSHNRITSGKLSKIPQYVQYLNLSHNDITYIPLEFKKLKYLKSVELAGNPINCTCDTLEVRNWLQDNNVWTDNHVICSNPLSLKGKPWLQIKQIDICKHIGSTASEAIINDGDNELMLGDQPVFGDGSGETDNDDEIGSDYLPIDYNSTKKSDEGLENIDEDIDGSGDLKDKISATENLNAVEGSGDTDDLNSKMIRSNLNINETTPSPTDYEDEGSGSGGGILFISQKHDIIDELDDNDKDDEEPISEPEEETERTPFSLDIFGKGIHKFDETTDESQSTEAPVEEGVIVPVKISETFAETETIKPTDDAEKNKSDIIVPVKDGNGQVSQSNVGVEDAKTSNTEESRSTYILLIILGILFVVLVIFAIFRRKKVNSRNRRLKNDAEAAAETELQDMDKKLLGKAIANNKNGNVEIIPLMGNRDKWDRKAPGNGNKPDDPYQNEIKKAQEPLLKKLDATEAESKPEPSIKPENQIIITEPEDKCKSSNENIPEPEKNNNNTNNNIDNGADVPQNIYPIPAPRKEESVPVHNPAAIQNGLPADDVVFAPISPKPHRYSPVYSPDTGRVKIKLTETPKPKTPMLVTRSRSNAGDIITTPNLSNRHNNLQNDQ